jgi:glycosyltransferase involved in cell wall biosynthesis
MPDGSPWPKISIVTPSFNQAQYLEETIRSVLLQGYPNLEYFIIDGGSTDGSVEIIKKYEPWLTYWVSEPDRGQSHAINKGWQHSTGEILGWLNSDDMLYPEALKQVAQAFKENPDAGLIHGKVITINESGAPIGTLTGGNLLLHESITTSVNPVAQPAAYITRTALNKVGVLDENLHVAMDWDLWIRIASNFPTVHMNKSWAYFRIWPDAKGSTLTLQAYTEHLAAVKKLFKKTPIKQIPMNVRRHALAQNYGKDALYRYETGERFNFRWHLFLSLLLAPGLKGGKAHNLVPELFLGKKLVNFLIKIKRRYQNPENIGIK